VEWEKEEDQEPLDQQDLKDFKVIRDLMVTKVKLEALECKDQ